MPAPLTDRYDATAFHPFSDAAMVALIVALIAK